MDKFENFEKEKLKELEAQICLCFTKNKGFPISLKTDNGCKVKEGDRIFKEENARAYETAPKAGRIFYLISSDRYKQPRSDAPFAVAIIVPMSWTEEDAIKNYYLLSAYQVIDNVRKNKNIPLSFEKKVTGTEDFSVSSLLLTGVLRSLLGGKK